MELILAGIILSYAVYVIYRKIKDIKKGKFCSCGCDNCNISKKCSQKNK